MGKLRIAIDGPAGCGKSTVAKRLAGKLGLTYIDTGAMYRAITYKTISRDIDLNDHTSIVRMAKKTDITMDNGRIYMDGEDVTLRIRSSAVDRNVSRVAAIPEVREILVGLQRNMAEVQGVVMDGRDIGTNVLPRADYKFYLTASLEERAKRRYKDALKQNPHASLEQIKENIEKRDRIDSTRASSPLKKADDAVLIDTTDKSVDQVIDEILSAVGCKGDVL